MTPFTGLNSWRVAAARALATAAVVGTLSALTTWSQTDELKTIAIAAGTPALTVLAARLGVEGSIDRPQKGS